MKDITFNKSNSSFFIGLINNKKNYFSDGNNNFHVKILPKYREHMKIKKECRKRFNYEQNLQNKNSNIILVGDYKDCRAATLFFCLKHLKYFLSIPTSVLNGTGCDDCHYEITRKRARTHEQYVFELAIKNPTVRVIGKYINANTNITHYCIIHEIYYEASPSYALKGCGCTKCHFERSGQKHRKTSEQYKQELKDKGSPIIPIEDYQGVKTPILHRNTLCGHEFITAPDNILHNLDNCPICLNRKISEALTKSNEEYIKELNEKNPGVIPLESYINSKTKLWHRFKCGHEALVVPHHVLEGHGCSICANIQKGLNNRLSQEEIVSRVFEVNPDIELLGKYETMSTPIQCKCKLCKNIWYPLPCNIISGHGCPKCIKSKGENLVLNVLEKYSIDYIMFAKFEGLLGIGGRSLSYDFYLPKYNKVIEVQGKQHEQPVSYFGGEDKFLIQQEHDKRKKEYANNHSIELIEIWYYEFNNIENIIINKLSLNCVETVRVA